MAVVQLQRGVISPLPLAATQLQRSSVNPLISPALTSNPRVVAAGNPQGPTRIKAAQSGGSPIQGPLGGGPLSGAGIPQGLIAAMIALSTLESKLEGLESNLENEWDERTKALGHVGSAINVALKAVASAVKKEVDDALFSLPLANDSTPAPREGALYGVGKQIYPNEPNSVVAAVLRLQWLTSLDTSKIFGLPLGGSVLMMVPGSFLYLLQNDDAGIIVQAPVVPKLEVKAPLGEELPLEVKAETEIESTFLWVRHPVLGGRDMVALFVNTFNNVVGAFSDNVVTLAIQSCESKKIGVAAPK